MPGKLAQIARWRRAISTTGDDGPHCSAAMPGDNRKRLSSATTSPKGVGVFTGGVIAQLGERMNGIHEVGGSIPPGSTTGR